MSHIVEAAESRGFMLRPASQAEHLVVEAEYLMVEAGHLVLEAEHLVVDPKHLLWWRQSI